MKGDPIVLIRFQQITALFLAASILLGGLPSFADKGKQASAATADKGHYVKEEPKLDLPESQDKEPIPGGSPTRVHRPGQDNSGFPPQAPAFDMKSNQAGNPTAGSLMPLMEAPAASPAKEKFPSVGQLEQLMFGHASPNIVVDNRLDKLEIAIFQKSSPELDIEQRIKRLKEVIIGEESGRTSSSYPSASGNPGDYANPGPGSQSRERESQPSLAFPNYGHYDLSQELSRTEAEKFGLVVINEIRAQQGLDELSWNDLAYKVAEEQVKDLCKRESVSHQNALGDNPDIRYTKAGGKDAIVESAILFQHADEFKPSRQLVVKILEALFARQDDRQCLLFPHASSFSMSFQWTGNRQKLVCLTEVVTKHGEMESIPLEASVGDKIEVKGQVSQPYKFHKLTLAWEGTPTAPLDDESGEALPYFPPLDYEAHATKSGRDYEKGIRILQIAGITAAIAGGLFIPPVALAAPLIAATVGASTPKPVSEIPVKGGVKVNGESFSHKMSLNNQGKEGIYYLTVWASTPTGDEVLPVSRRAIIARKGAADRTSVEPQEKAGSKPADEQKVEKSKDENSEKKDLPGEPAI